MAEYLTANLNEYRTYNVSVEDKIIKCNKEGEIRKGFDNFGNVTGHKLVDNISIYNIKAGNELLADYATYYSGGFSYVFWIWLTKNRIETTHCLENRPLHDCSVTDLKNI